MKQRNTPEVVAPIFTGIIKNMQKVLTIPNALQSSSWCNICIAFEVHSLLLPIRTPNSAYFSHSFALFFPFWFQILHPPYKLNRSLKHIGSDCHLCYNHQLHPGLKWCWYTTAERLYFQAKVNAYNQSANL